MHGSAILRFVTSSIHNFELQGMFRNCCRIIWGWAVDIIAQIRQNAANIAVKIRTFIQWKRHPVSLILLFKQMIRILNNYSCSNQHHTYTEYIFSGIYMLYNIGCTSTLTDLRGRVGPYPLAHCAKSCSIVWRNKK